MLILHSTEIFKRELFSFLLQMLTHDTPSVQYQYKDVLFVKKTQIIIQLTMLCLEKLKLIRILKNLIKIAVIWMVSVAVMAFIKYEH